jgi:hypothetical protein
MINIIKTAPQANNTTTLTFGLEDSMTEIAKAVGVAWVEAQLNVYGEHDLEHTMHVNFSWWTNHVTNDLEPAMARAGCAFIRGTSFAKNLEEACQQAALDEIARRIDNLC